VEKEKGKKVLLIGGGIGIPPMLNCAKALKKNGAEPLFAVGYRTNDTYLLDDLKKTAPVLISTDDGSLGTHGTVVDAIREQKAEADVIFACGPKPMLCGVKAYAEEKKIPCYVSMEERMACGIGVCLGCVTKTTKPDEHSLVKNARVCKDGPVFNAEDVDLT
jgi:dihydroorotate dehydrogenase electron transfer subunit